MSPTFSPIWVAALAALTLACPAAHAVELAAAGPTGRVLVGSNLYTTPVGYTGITYIHPNPGPAPESAIVYDPDRGEVYIRNQITKIIAHTRPLVGPPTSVMVGSEADFQGAGLRRGDVLVDPTSLKVSDFDGRKFVPRAEDAAAPVRAPASSSGPGPGPGPVGPLAPAAGTPTAAPIRQAS